MKNIILAMRLFNAPFLNEFSAQLEAGQQPREAYALACAECVRHDFDNEHPAKRPAKFTPRYGGFSLLWLSNGGNEYVFSIDGQFEGVSFEEGSSLAEQLRVIQEHILNGTICPAQEGYKMRVREGGRRKRMKQSAEYGQYSDNMLAT